MMEFHKANCEKMQTFLSRLQCARVSVTLQTCVQWTYFFDSHVEVRFEGHGGLEPLAILLDEVEVDSTHQVLILIQHICLNT